MSMRKHGPLPFVGRSLINSYYKIGRTLTGGKKKSLSTPLGPMDYLHYKGRPGSPTLLMIHGFSDVPESFMFLSRSLKKHFSIYLLALPGFDQYGRERHFDYSLDNYLLFFRTFLKQIIGEGPFHLFGHSLGGALAMALYEDVPEQIESLVLMNSAGLEKEGVNTAFGDFLEGNNPFLINSKKDYDELLLRIFSNSDPIRGPIKDYFYNENLKSRSHFKKIAQDLFDSVEHHMDRGSIIDLEKVNVPSLVVWGENDGLFPTEIGEEFHKRIKDSRYVVLKDVGHVPHFEAPKALRNVLKGFYAEHVM